jgi:pimeloyl-ACP methyl ester carboxylesterase
MSIETSRITVRDGLKLFVRHFPAAGSRLAPVLCLPGLTRNGRDFVALATALSEPRQATARPVYTLDLRGRGASDWDADPKKYSVPVEAQDVLDVMAALGLDRPAIVGTSRGGLIAMVLAALQPTALGPVVLNDIGPVIERDGLVRIASYVGQAPLPATWPEAAAMVQEIDQRQFPAVPADGWEAIARQRFNDVDGRPAPGYDPRIGDSISVLDGPLPELWPQFEALKHVPVLVIRGVESDLLSAATVAEMTRRHPRLSAISVADEGHAPLLQDASTISAIRRFLDAAG